MLPNLPAINRLQHAAARLIIKPAFYLLLLCTSLMATAQTLPANFIQVQVANGISKPTTMAFAPDGRLFVAQQTGALRVIKNGVLLSKPFLTLNVDSSGERGLLGVAFDPAFSTNHYIYLYHTLPTGANNRISRFTANGDTAALSSEVVVLDLDPLSSATNHNGGTMQFGKDGKLYIGVGENANPPNAQNLDTYLGKILRINPDGSAPADNPFPSGSAQRRRVWTYGMRNPFTLAIQPATGRVFVDDVGQNTWEEIDDCTKGGGNYGWPKAEGTSSNPSFVNPIYEYGHGTGDSIGCAITGGTFFNPATTNYPSQYTGNYFFLDYCSKWINRLSLSGSTATHSAFGSSLPGGLVCMTTGPDGNLYFLSRTNAAVYKIVYLSAASHPTNTVAGLHYNYYQGTWRVLPNFTLLKPVSSGSIANISLNPRARDDSFGFRFTGYISVPAAGVYQFFTTSDDGSKFYIDSLAVVKNDGIHAAREASGSIGLQAGKHKIIIDYFEHTGLQSLTVSYSGPGITKRVIPDTALSHDATASQQPVTETRIDEKLSNTGGPLLLDVYPNPAQSQVTLVLNHFSGSGHVKMFDAAGQLVKEQVVTQATLQLFTGDLRNGLYLITVEDQNGRATKKLRIEK